MGGGGGVLSLFDYKEHGVVDAIVSTRILTRTTCSADDVGQVASSRFPVNGLVRLCIVPFAPPTKDQLRPPAHSSALLVYAELRKSILVHRCPWNVRACGRPSLKA